MSDINVKEDVEQIGETLAIQPRCHCSYIKINVRGLNRTDVFVIVLSSFVAFMTVFTGVMVILLIYSRVSS